MNIIAPQKKILIFWEGFPACGLLVKKVLDQYPNTVLLATKPAVAFRGLETLLGHRITWLNEPNDIWRLREKYRDRNFIVHTGWRYSGWRKYDRQQKRSGAKIVVVADNRYRGDLRQYIGALWFRLRLRRLFDAAFVPGKSSVKLLRFLGMPKGKIFTGNYGAYSGLYFETTPIENRNNEFLFIGQLIKRKGVDVLLSAYATYRRQGGTWSLRIVGSGKMLEQCKHAEGVIVEGFAQPHQINSFMNNAKVLILPSRDDNWGTVVAEAAACGMHIITTKKTGSGFDIIRDTNGILLKNLSSASLMEAMFHYEQLTLSLLKEGSTESKRIAHDFNEDSYLTAFNTMLNTL